MPSLRFYCEALLEVDVPDGQYLDIPELAREGQWDVIRSLRLVAGSGYPCRLVALDFANLAPECEDEHEHLHGRQACSTCGFRPDT